MIYNSEFKPILADDNLWVFDQTDLKDAITLLLLNDLNEKIKHDLELKKLISMQFETDSDMKTWAMNFYDTVSFKNEFEYLIPIEYLRRPRIYQNAYQSSRFSFPSTAKFQISTCCQANTTLMP